MGYAGRFPYNLQSSTPIQATATCLHLKSYAIEILPPSPPYPALEICH